jgi:hypothetical protein
MARRSAVKKVAVQNIWSGDGCEVIVRRSRLLRRDAGAIAGDRAEGVNEDGE